MNIADFNIPELSHTQKGYSFCLVKLAFDIPKSAYFIIRYIFELGYIPESVILVFGYIFCLEKRDAHTAGVYFLRLYFIWYIIILFMLY